LETGRRLKREFPKADVRIPVAGPFSIAFNLLGISALCEYALTDPENVLQLLQRLANHQVVFCRAIAVAGLDLAFFESGNPACQSELGLITDIYEEFKNKVNFVAISVDKDPAKLAEYLMKADLPWLVLLYGGNLELLENYDAVLYPHFILLNDKGQIVKCPAPSPSENIIKLLGSI